MVASLLPVIPRKVRRNELVVGVRLLVINYSQLSATILIFSACAEFGASTYPSLLRWCPARDLFGSQIPVTTEGSELRISCIQTQPTRVSHMAEWVG